MGWAGRDHSLMVLTPRASRPPKLLLCPLWVPLLRASQIELGWKGPQLDAADPQGLKDTKASALPSLGANFRASQIELGGKGP